MTIDQETGGIVLVFARSERFGARSKKHTKKEFTTMNTKPFSTKYNRVMSAAKHVIKCSNLHSDSGIVLRFKVFGSAWITGAFTVLMR